MPPRAASFLSIPFEIRLEIYHFLLRGGELSVRIDPDKSDVSLPSTESAGTQLQAIYSQPNIGSILQASRQIREEGLPLFHALIELRITNLRTGTNQKCFANFPTVRLINPLIPWEDLQRAHLRKVRHLTIDKGIVYWGCLDIEFWRPLNPTTLAHHGAEEAINSYMIELWVEKMREAMAQMRNFALDEINSAVGVPDLSVTMNFNIPSRAEDQVLWLRRWGPCDFSLILDSNERFLLRYKYEDEVYTVRQRRYRGCTHLKT